MGKALAGAALAAVAACAVQFFAGDWRGVLQLDARERLRLMVRIWEPGEGLVAGEDGVLEGTEGDWEGELDCGGIKLRAALTGIANCDTTIAGCDMLLGEKLRYLREVEGALRGLGRELTQQEVVRLLKKEMGKAISQSYLSQIESGARPHLTSTTRMLLAKFFKVHPGYLVDDPEGYHEELRSDVGATENKLDLWLIDGAENFRNDPELCEALLTLARHDDSRMCVMLLGAILDNPGLAERLLHVLKPAAGGRHSSLSEQEANRTSRKGA